jgi:hypothetical protein
VFFLHATRVYSFYFVGTNRLFTGGQYRQ